MKSSFHAIKRKNGLLEARYWARYPDGTKQQKSLYGRDKKLLKERWVKARAEAAQNLSMKTGGQTTAAFLTGWIKEVQGIKETTRNGYKNVINKHIIPRIGNKPISEVNTETLQIMLNDMYDVGCSVRMLQITKWVMCKALRKARTYKLTNQYIDSKEIELPKYEFKETKTWNIEELKKFLEACKNDEYEWFFLLYTTYGLRRGEAIPIEWEDINWQERTIYIHRQYTRVGNKLVVETPKTATSIRKLPILPHIENYLDKLNPQRNKKGLIVSMNGEMVTPDKISRRFKRISKNAGLPIVNLKSTRHAVATFMKGLGIPVKDAQAILGHSTPLTTLKYYQHTDIKEKRENLAKYSKFMGF